MRWSDDEDAPHQDLVMPSANEQLLRFIALHDSSVGVIERGNLERADASFVGTDFP